MKLRLTGSADTPLVLVGNFEVEDRWAVGEPGLPRVTMNAGRAVVDRMDELTLSFAGADDHVILKAPPDPEFLGYLDDLGVALPTVLTAGAPDPRRTVTEDALADPVLVATLGDLAARGARLWPHGVSAAEERLAARSGLPLATSPAAVCKAVNSKIYSRLAAERAGVRQPRGLVCRDLGELAAACDQARRWLAGGRTVVLKDAFGVSGKGILVVRDAARLDQVQRMIVRRATRSGDPRVALVMEEWLPKRTDLNYQFTVDPAGDVHLDFVKEAITSGGVHQGHRMPVRLPDRQLGELAETARVLGGRLAADGYVGVVGVDALLTTDDQLFPMIEINARNNMSTYQERLREAFFDRGQMALARHYPVRPRRRVSFGELRCLLDGVLFEAGTNAGALVNGFATVNAGASGRLYAIVIAGSPERVVAIDDEVSRRLSTLELLEPKEGNNP